VQLNWTVSYCLIFNFNVITTIFKLGNQALYFRSTSYHIVFDWRSLQFLSPVGKSYWYDTYYDMIRIMIYLNNMQYRYNVDTLYYNIMYTFCTVTPYTATSWQYNINIVTVFYAHRTFGYLGIFMLNNSKFISIVDNVSILQLFPNSWSPFYIAENLLRVNGL